MCSREIPGTQVIVRRQKKGVCALDLRQKLVYVRNRATVLLFLDQMNMRVTLDIRTNDLDAAVRRSIVDHIDRRRLIRLRDEGFNRLGKVDRMVVIGKDDRQRDRGIVVHGSTLQVDDRAWG